MNTVVKNIIAVIVGLLVGHTLNFALIKLGYQLFPIEGVDPNNLEDLKRVMPNLSIKYFVFPFLAHALGTFFGALVTSLIAKNHKMKFAFGVGIVFLTGGILASIVLPAPTWFTVVDLAMAYIPMAWIGGKLVVIKTKPVY